MISEKGYDYDELEAVIGRFVIWFERVNMVINETIHEIASKIGVKDDHHDFIEILLHDATAQSMMNYFRGYIIQYYNEDLQDPQTAKYFHKLIEKLKVVIEFRNVLLHSTFYFLDNDEEGELIYRDTAKRYGINKTGLHLKIDKVNEDLEKLIRDKASDCWHLFHFIRNLPFGIIQDDKPLSTMFNDDVVKWLTGDGNKKP